MSQFETLWSVTWGFPTRNQILGIRMTHSDSTDDP